MKKFIYKFTVLILLVILSLSSISLLCKYIVGNQYGESYQASVYDKIERLNSIEGRKIVLAGDSNLAFGIDSKLMEEKLGISVVNMGLHAGLGSEFLDNLGVLNIKEGDLIVLSHLDYETSKFDHHLMWSTIEWNFDLWKLVPKREYLKLLFVLPYYESLAIDNFLFHDDVSMSNPVYRRDAFNEYGDDIYSSIDKSTYEFKEGDLDPPVMDKATIKRINKLYKYVKSKGGDLVITAYPFADGKFSPDHKYYKEFEEKLRKNLDCPIISDFDDYYFDYKYFYNSPYHLNEEGKKIRTEQLILDIEKYLSEK